MDGGVDWDGVRGILEALYRATVGLEQAFPGR